MMYNDASAFEASLQQDRRCRYRLRLYVAGITPNSVAAIRNLRKLCEANMAGRYDLKVVDIFQQPGIARAGQVVAAPTLVKELPLPARRFVGDMSNTQKLLDGLDLARCDR